MDSQSASSSKITFNSIKLLQQKPADPLRNVSDRANKALTSYPHLQHNMPQQAVEIAENCKHSDKLAQHADSHSADPKPNPQDSNHPQKPTSRENSQYYSSLMHNVLMRPGTTTASELLPMERFLFLDETDCATYHDLVMIKALQSSHE
ncbi:hypothetical protein BDZ91DRAFT_799741 [Kalaharituber pfeilii]|nr:hypothetical protein BDZ91DRAFT_799741 [Kalaharituber pfeilii]